MYLLIVVSAPAAINKKINIFIKKKDNNNNINFILIHIKAVSIYISTVITKL